GPALAIPKQGGLNQGISATMTYVQSPDDNHSNENLSSVNPGSRADTNSTPMSAVPATVQPSSPGAGSSGINAVAGMQGSPFTSEIPPNPDSPRELQAGFLPFPDEHGRPIPASNEPPQFLPFPDSKGNPIPV